MTARQRTVSSMCSTDATDAGRSSSSRPTVRDRAKVDDLLHRKRYLKQMARYVDAVEALLGERPRLLLCMLDMDRRIHLVEDPILATNGCQDTALS